MSTQSTTQPGRTAATARDRVINAARAYVAALHNPSESGNAEEDALVAAVRDIDATTPADPDDFWVQFSADLHGLADRLATLAGTEGQPAYAGLFFSDYTERNAAKSVPVVDAIAAALDTTAATKTTGRGTNRNSEHQAQTQFGKVRVRATASVPTPPTPRQTRAALEAELAELRAQVAQQQTTGGAR